MGEILKKIRNNFNQKYDCVEYQIDYVASGSFTGYCGISALYGKFLREYDRNEIKTKGLIVCLNPLYHHKVRDVLISCPEMKQLRSNDVMKCSVYRAMKERYEYSLQNLYHMEQYAHFPDEYAAKPVCKYEDDCKAHTRLENGGNALKDKCHMKIYRHPPRKRNVQLQKNVNAFLMNKNYEENHEIYTPTADDDQRYKWNNNDGHLNALMQEVRANGFARDLCMKCRVNDECKHGEEHSILRVVYQKMDSHRHKQMGKPLNRAQML
eukprot:1010443_1